MAKLKLGPLPKLGVVRMTVTLPEPLKEELDRYTAEYNRGQTLLDFLSLAQQRSREFAMAMNEAAATPAALSQTPNPSP